MWKGVSARTFRFPREEQKNTAISAESPHGSYCRKGLGGPPASLHPLSAKSRTPEEKENHYNNEATVVCVGMIIS